MGAAPDAMLSPAMAVADPRVGGTILVAAGAYQLTPMKRACLTHCRSPLGFLMASWRDGKRGALQMGTRHGRTGNPCLRASVPSWLLLYK